jgi:hypothetical protein
VKSWRPIERWLEPSLSVGWVAAVTGPAPLTMFFLYSTLDVLRRIAAGLGHAMIIVGFKRQLFLCFSRELQSADSGIVRPPLRAASADALIGLAERLLSNPPRLVFSRLDWARELLALCVELQELEREGHLSPRQVVICRSFVHKFARPAPVKAPAS